MLLVVYVGIVLAIIVISIGGYREAKEAAVNGLPSIRLLSEARNHLLHLTGEADEVLRQREQGQLLDTTVLQRELHIVGSDLLSYVALPQYPGEQGLASAAREELLGLEQATESLLAELSAAAPGEPSETQVHDAHVRWLRSAEHLGDVLGALVVFNADHVVAHTDRIMRLTLSAMVVLVVGTLGSLIIAALALRSARQAVLTREAVLTARARDWETFSARVAHDLVSPLQTVSLAVGVANDHCDDPQVKAFVTKGLAALQRVRTTMDVLLEFARSGGAPAPGERSNVPHVISRIIDELRDLAREHAVELSMTAMPGCEVRCSAGLLHVAVQNLVQNSIKHMGDSPLRRVTVRASVRGEMVRIEVVDTGPGVAAERQSEIFRPYVRASVPGVQGLGLGLATVKQLVEARGGRVGVQGAKGAGSVFWLELPLAEPVLTSPPPGPPHDRDRPSPSTQL